MTDARAEDREQLVGQPVEATQDGICPGCGKTIRGRRDGVPGELILRHESESAWLHAPDPDAGGSCVDDFDAKLAEADDRPADCNALSFWFPRVESAGLPVPETRIVRAPGELLAVLDGETPAGWGGFIVELGAACNAVGWPCFLRTGHGSGKHEWARTCFVPSRAALEAHVAALVEWSACAGPVGLSTDEWAARELIDTEPLFRCTGYHGFPVVREFRWFVRDGVVEHVQPYWPPDAVAQGRPNDLAWAAKLVAASRRSLDESTALGTLATEACRAVGGGYWSIDFLEDRHGDWWLTDMADGDQSFRWEPAEADQGRAV